MNRNLLVVALMSLSSFVFAGCASESEPDAEEVESANLTGTVDPTATSPVAWACNFDNGNSAVFVQVAVHKPRGTVTYYEGAQNPRATFADLAAGGGLKALSSSPVKFGDEGLRTDFMHEPTVGGALGDLILSVQREASFKIGTRIYPWTGTLKGVEATAGCWGVR